MRGVTAGVDDALGNALVVEVLGLLDVHHVFEKVRSALVGLEGIFVVGDDGAALVGHGGMCAAGYLVELAGVADEVVIGLAGGAGVDGVFGYGADGEVAFVRVGLGDERR